ncbi:hypothetical protein F2Q70_00017708 [Brassica cretica]|uniref:Uncharacterized protein n=1 Tax=Brassica cretica TaxID=69181 RepID=A0A8S9HTZ8_BRACR|nr:hypothetical protein F2Q70_00017708 [Brassica cretica]
MQPIAERMDMSKASHFAVPKHQRPPIWTEEAIGFHKRVKRIHDPVKIVVPCAVFETESPIPPDRNKIDKDPAEATSIDTDRIPSNDTNKPASIDAITSPSIDSGRVSEHKEFDVCGNLRDGDTTTQSDKSGGKKRRNWKKRKRIKNGPQMEPIEERMYMSKASHLAVPKHQRPPIWTEEAAGFHKRVKRIHDPVKIVVPCAVFEAESPIPPDRRPSRTSINRHRPDTIDRHQQTNINRRYHFSIDRQWTRIIAEGVRCVWKSQGRRYHHAIRQVWGKEEEELEEEKKDQGWSSGIIDPSLLRLCQEI